MNRLLKLSTFAFSLLLGFHFVQAATPHPAFIPLITRLLEDGVDSLRIERVFQDERVEFIDQLVVKNLVPKDHPGIYEGFLVEAQVEDGRRFQKEWSDEIQNLLDGTQIPTEIVVAMLKIESDLGRNPGDHPIVATLATISSMNDRKYWGPIADTSRTMGSEKLKRRAERRSGWAYKELLTLFELCNVHGWDPLSIEGSWAGAFGWAQFLPTSYAYYARDGNGDGRIEPNNFYDAVASLVCYLRKARWSHTAWSQRKALLRYNPSQAYADAVLEYASRLKMSVREDGLAPLPPPLKE